MSEGLKRADSEDPFADLLAASYEATPGSRRQLDGASVAMGDESAQGGLGILSSAAATVAGREDRRGTIGFGRTDAETPGGYSRADEDAVDLAMVSINYSDFRQLVVQGPANSTLDLADGTGTTGWSQMKNSGNNSFATVTGANWGEASQSYSAWVNDNHAIVLVQSGVLVV